MCGSKESKIVEQKEELSKAPQLTKDIDFDDS
jgi:hypothetical protein